MDIWQMSFTEFEFLTNGNYSTWKTFMQKLLASYGQEHLDIVIGKHTRVDAQDKQKFDLVDEIALSTIRLAIDAEIHPWVLHIFSSSKELWDLLQLKFEKGALVAARMEKSDMLDDICLSIPDIQADHADCNGVFWDIMAGTGTGKVMQQSDLFHDVKGNINLRQQVSSCVSLNFGLLPLPVDIKPCSNAHPSIYQFLECSNLFMHGENLVAAENSHEIMELHSELPFLDVEYDNDYSLVEEIWNDVAAQADPIRDKNEQAYGRDIIFQKLEWFPLLHDHLSHVISWDQMFGYQLQLHVTDLKDDLVQELPWLDIDSKTHSFQAIISQVSQHELPLYICLHIPFGCTHDGRVEHKTEYLASILYNDVKGSSNMLTVSSMCLHQPNQVLLIINRSEDQFMDNNVLSGSHGSVGPVSELQSSRLEVLIRKIQLEKLLGTGKSHDSALQHFDSYVFQGLILQAHIGNDMNVYFHTKREWYRGRKIWFKAEITWQPWLIFWLSLLYVVSTA